MAGEFDQFLPTAPASAAAPVTSEFDQFLPPDVLSMPQGRRGTAPKSGYYTGGDTKRSDWKAPPMTPGGGMDALMGFGKGASLGLTPYVRAGGMTAAGMMGMPGQSSEWDQNLNVSRIMEQQAQANSPILYGGGQLAGGAATGVLGGMGATARAAEMGMNPLKAAMVGNTASNVAQGAVAGGAEGGTQGAVAGATTAAILSAAGAGVAGLAKVMGPKAAAIEAENAILAADREAGNAIKNAAGEVLEKPRKLPPLANPAANAERTAAYKQAIAEYDAAFATSRPNQAKLQTLYGGRSVSEAKKLAKADAIEVSKMQKAAEVVGAAGIGAGVSAYRGDNPLYGAVAGGAAAAGGRTQGVTNYVTKYGQQAMPATAAATGAVPGAVGLGTGGQEEGLSGLIKRLRSAWAD